MQVPDARRFFLEVSAAASRPHLAGVLRAGSAGVRPSRPLVAGDWFAISFGRHVSHRTPQIRFNQEISFNQAIGQYNCPISADIARVPTVAQGATHAKA
jgi:hypothetical protein